MRSTESDLFSTREIALAAGVAEADVVAALGGARGLVGRVDAVRIGRMLVSLQSQVASRQSAVVSRQSAPLFSLFTDAEPGRRKTGVPLALSSTLHAALIAFAVFATFNLSSRAEVLKDDDRPAEPMRL